MPVKSQHPEYTEYYNKWDRCEIVADGQDAVHKAGTEFLPRLSDQTEEEYQAYKCRTPFYNATWRTIVGLQGMLFRKPPQVKVPAIVEPMLENITLDGTPLHILALEISEEALKIGRVGIFVDYPIADTVNETKADDKLLGRRPLLKLYGAKSIINWKTRTIKNATILSMVVLKECVLAPVDEFEDKAIEQYRVLDLIDMEVGGVVRPVYRVREIQIETENGKENEVTKSTVYPQIDGNYLDYIPFYFIGVDDVNWEVDEPPLIDLVDLNLSHYRTTADYEHGCHFTGLPTPVVSGYTPEKSGEKFTIGSMTAWVFPRPDAKATFLEFTGEGLNALKDNLERKESQMALLGARMLEVSRSNGVESADTAAIHRSGEQSMLSSVAQAISIGVTKALQVFCRFAGADEKDVSFELNRDFFPAPMDSLTLTALIAAWQNGAISYETLFANLKKGEIVKTDAIAEDEQKAIKADPPPMAVAGTTPGSPSPNSPKTAAGGTNKDPSITQMQKGKTGSS